MYRIVPRVSTQRANQKGKAIEMVTPARNHPLRYGARGAWNRRRAPAANAKANARGPVAASVPTLVGALAVLRTGSRAVRYAAWGRTSTEAHMKQIEKSIYALVVSGVSIEGVTRETENPMSEKHGETVISEAVKRVTVAHEKLHKEAKKFESAARGLQDKFGRKVEGFGHLTNAEGAEAFRKAAAKLAEEIAEFNGQTGNPHRVRVKMMKVREVSVSFDEQDFAALYTEVSTEIENLRNMLKNCEFDAVMNALKRQQRLPGCLPSLNASVVADALEAIRIGRNAGAAYLRAHEGDKAGALALPEMQAADAACEAALGWLAPACVVAMPTVSAAV